jgi:hypothetical protein
MGRGPGAGLGVGILWVKELSNAVKALDVTVKVLVKADVMVPSVKVDGERAVVKPPLTLLGLGLGDELVAVTVVLKLLPMMEELAEAAH